MEQRKLSDQANTLVDLAKVSWQRADPGPGPRAGGGRESLTWAQGGVINCTKLPHNRISLHIFGVLVSFANPHGFISSPFLNVVKGTVLLCLSSTLCIPKVHE